MIASLLFPYDNDADQLIDGWLDELEREGCLARYGIGKDTYIYLCNWSKHQRIDKPSASKIPEFQESLRIVANPREDSCEEGKGKEGSRRERNGVDGKGVEGKGKDLLSENSDDIALPSKNQAAVLAENIGRVIDHLNTKTGQSFRASAKANSALIAARLDSGVTVEQCIAVINAKAAEWLSDAKMRGYLRPSTLFNATKFESYLGALGNGKSRPAGRPALN
jgi:uncharacterized phage protein (TIGR02220 family)